MDIRILKRQHRSIIAKAAVLGGLCGLVRTREDAHEARRMIEDINGELVAHLTIEDTQLYPLLMNARDESRRALADEAFAGIGGLLEIWVRFCEHWTVTAILADPRRFALATGRMLRALSVRVEMEEDGLYPAAEAEVEARRGGHDIAAA